MRVDLGQWRVGWGDVLACIFVGTMLLLVVAAVITGIAGDETMAGNLAIGALMLGLLGAPAWVAFVLGRRISEREVEDIRTEMRQDFDEAYKNMDDVRERIDALAGDMLARKRAGR